MIKRITLTIFFALIGGTIGYAAMTFVIYDSNPANWDAEFRFIAMVLTFGCAFLSAAAYNLAFHDNQDN